MLFLLILVPTIIKGESEWKEDDIAGNSELTLLSCPGTID